jgi:hypothetical protein
VSSALVSYLEHILNFKWAVDDQSSYRNGGSDGGSGGQLQGGTDGHHHKKFLHVKLTVVV